jgi:Transcriptional regulatory protein, C terminal
VADAASRALDAPVLVIAMPDESGRRLDAVHVRGLPRDGGEDLSAVLRDARWTVEPGAAPRLPGADWLAAVPIPLTGREDGVLLVGRASDRRFTREERAYLRVLTSLLGLALHRMALEPPADSHLRVGDLEIDLEEQRVVIGERDARLTPSEIRLLLYLAEEPGRPRTRRDILRHLWRTEHVVDERACDVHISNLRRKIERDPSHPKRLVTVRSVGYALQPM